MIVLTGGGTGGHLTGIRALKDAFIKEGVDPIFIGSIHGLDRKWFAEEAGFAARYFLNTRGVVNRRLLGKIVSFAMIARETITAIGILKQHKVKAVLSVGGYPAAAASFAATVRRISLFIHEHNVSVSHLHRIMMPYAQELFSSYDGRSPVLDYPVDMTFFDGRRRRNHVQRVLFLGGSQGASFINDFALAVAPVLDRRGIAITHQTGKPEFKRVKTAYEAMNVDADCFAFDRDLASRMVQADFAVTRAGAGTLWETAANGLPALFIPYPYAARDHQYYNAKHFADQGLGFVARQSEVNSDILLAALKCDARSISSRLMALIRPGGAEKIVQHVLKLIRE